MRVAEVITEAKEAMKVKQVFGEPYERDGITVIPAATVSGGGGGGGPAETGGAGFGLSARPVGAFVIRNGEVSWQPALDLNRVILVGQLVAIVALLSIRTIVKALATRRR